MKAETKALLDSFKREFAVKCESDGTPMEASDEVSRIIDKVFNAAYVWGKNECMQAVEEVLYDRLGEDSASELLNKIDKELWD